MDDIDRRLLTSLQNGIPLECEPFRVLGQKIGIDEAEVLLRLGSLQKAGLFQPLRAVTAPRSKLFYSALAAFSFDPGHLEERVQIFFSHPGVSFCHVRDHEINLWFLMTAGSAKEWEENCLQLQKLTSPKVALTLPSLKQYQNGAFQSSGGSAGAGAEDSQELSSSELDCFYAVSRELPLRDRPFLDIARRLNVSEWEVIEILQKLQKNKRIIKIVPAGFGTSPALSASAVIVWQVPEERREAVAAAVSEDKCVRACVIRQPWEKFPYSIYAYTKFFTQKECAGLAEELGQKVGAWPRQVLATVKQYPNQEMGHFTKDLHDWWQESEKSLATL